MSDRLLFAASAVARVLLVVVAFGLAVGSIGLASVRGFCPELGGEEEAAALAAPGAGLSLATIVEEPAEEVDPNSPAPDEQGPADDSAPEPGEEGPADEAPADEGDGGSDGACPGGAQRCLPPLWSSVLILGETACHDQAPARLRSTLVPSFVGATVLLAGAWWLRPNRLHGRDRDEGRDKDRDDTTSSRQTPTGS